MAQFSTTIRRNATKKIESILRSAILIREYRYDDMGDTCGTVTVDRVLSVIRQFEADRVYQNGGVLTVRVDGNWSFTAYANKEAAAATLTPQAFAKYFPSCENKRAVQVGTKIVYAGNAGVVVSEYDENLIEIRLPGGTICVGKREFDGSKQDAYVVAEGGAL